MKWPKVYEIRGLPLAKGGRLHPEKMYRFWFGFPDYLPGNGKVILHIPEQPHRDADGRSLHPEQAQWIEETVRRERLDVKAVWHAHWRFDNQQALNRFLELLTTG